MRTMKTIIVMVIIVIVLIILLSSCKSAEIIDIINKDTENFFEKYSFSEPTLVNYQIEGILFVPYTNHNPMPNYEQKYHNYALNLATYRKKGNKSNVHINNVTLAEINDVNFNSITKDLNKNLNFIENKGNPGIEFCEIPIIAEINDYDMELTKKSKIRIVLNVTVEENGNTTTGNLEYIFETKIRKYLVQPT